MDRSPSNVDRRTVCRRLVNAVAIAGSIRLGRPALGAIGNNRDVRIESVSVQFQDFVFRSPLKFAGTVVTSQTMSTATCTVRTRDGKAASGFGALPLNYTFTYPSAKLSPESRLMAMKELATVAAKLTSQHAQFGHPIELNWELAPQFDQAAVEVSRRLKLADPIPKLCTLVTAGAIDAAIHDAYGKLHEVSSFQTYSPEFMNFDLSRYLGKEYSGEYPNRYVRVSPKPKMPLCHLVSAVDPITDTDVKERSEDGLPQSLVDWIAYNGLKYFKIKLNGDNLKWDVQRMLDIDRAVTEVQKMRRVSLWSTIPDFNEKCPHVDYYLEFLTKLRERSPECFNRIEYVEQPTHRDLASHPENDMHTAAELRPVMIDESVIDMESVSIAKRQGWSGVIIKSPKGLTHMLMIAAVADRHRMLVAGGDMTCPGAALIQTTALQARLPGVTNIEANARQFLPAANKPYEAQFPGLFRITDGELRTSELLGHGLSCPSLQV